VALIDDLHQFLDEEDERVRDVLLRRFWTHIREKRFCAYRAMRRVPGTNRLDRESLATELQRNGYTEREILEMAVREVVEEDLEEIYSERGGIGLDVEDLSPYLEEEDLSPEGKERLVQDLADMYEEGARIMAEKSRAKAKANGRL
jgi:hypothetical protein